MPALTASGSRSPSLSRGRSEEFRGSNPDQAVPVYGRILGDGPWRDWGCVDSSAVRRADFFLQTPFISPLFRGVAVAAGVGRPGPLAPPALAVPLGRVLERLPVRLRQRRR